GEQPTQDLLEGQVPGPEPAADHTDQQVDQGDEGDERQQHGADVQGQLHPVGRTAGGGVDDVAVGELPDLVVIVVRLVRLARTVLATRSPVGSRIDARGASA